MLFIEHACRASASTRLAQLRAHSVRDARSRPRSRCTAGFPAAPAPAGTQPGPRDQEVTEDWPVQLAQVQSQRQDRLFVRSRDVIEARGRQRRIAVVVGTCLAVPLVLVSSNLIAMIRRI